MSIGASSVGSLPVAAGGASAGGGASPAVLTSLAASLVTSTTARLTVSASDNGSGSLTLYIVIYDSALGAPSDAQIRAGTDINDDPADWDGSAAWTGSGQFFDPTGLTPGAAYDAAAVVYDDVAATYSNVVTGTWTQANDIEIAGSVGVAAAMGVSGSASQATEVAGAVGIAAAAGVSGSASQATTIAGSVGVAAAAGVAGEASITNDITISGAAGVAAAAGVTGEATVGSDITISGSVGVAAAAGVAGVPGVAIVIQAAVGAAAAAGVSGLAATGIIIDSTPAVAGAAGVTGSLSLDIVVPGVVAAAAAAGVAGSISITGGSAGGADVWNYVLSNGYTAEENVVAIRQLLSELHLIHGLTSGSPLTVTATDRAAGAVAQAVTNDGTTVTVTRS